MTILPVGWLLIVLVGSHVIMSTLIHLTPGNPKSDARPASIPYPKRGDKRKDWSKEPLPLPHLSRKNRPPA